MSEEVVRVGVIGLGVMGSQHAQYLHAGAIAGATLTAVSDVLPARREWAAATLPGVAVFDTPTALLDSGRVDGVLIATPHYQHPVIAEAAFHRHLHVLIEKPAGVFTRAVRAMNAAARAAGTVFGIMYNERTHPVYAKARDLVRSGELGPLKRVEWVVTHWYRPQAYYDSGTWRATWAGEGGGVLINQAPHQLDLVQWVPDLRPTRVRAFMQFGRYHTIEVEDQVTAYWEYASGATGVFITSTGEAPGTNRLELVGDQGKLVVEDDTTLTFWRLRQSEREFNRTYRGMFGRPEAWRCEVPVGRRDREAHQAITQNWVDAIRQGTPLLAPGEEGLWGLELSNAMHLSAWTDRWVPLPLDDDAFVAELKAHIDQSRGPRDGLAGVVL